MNWKKFSKYKITKTEPDLKCPTEVEVIVSFLNCDLPIKQTIFRVRLGKQRNYPYT